MERVMATTFGEAVKEARMVRGWSQDALAEAVGTTQSSIDRIERGATARSRVAPEVAAALGLAYPFSPTDKISNQEPIRLSNSDIRQYIDIYRSREASSPKEKYGDFLIEREAVRSEDSPSMLRDVPDAFGFIVPNYNASPAYEAGDMVFVHPALTLVRDCDVLVCGFDEEGDFPGLPQIVRGMIRRLRGWDGTSWHVQEIAPAGGGEVALSKTDWPRIMRIVGKVNRP